MSNGEALVVAFLTSEFVDEVVDPFTSVVVGAETDDELDKQPYTIRVLMLPGGRQFTVVTPVISIDCFSAVKPLRETALNFCLEVDKKMTRDLRGRTIGGTCVSQVETRSGPAWRPYDDTGLRRFGATYSLTLRDI